MFIDVYLAVPTVIWGLSCKHQIFRSRQTAHQNRLLASLPHEDYERLRRRLEPVALQNKQTLYKANAPIEFVHFIETGVGSLVITMANGEAAEVGTIGNEGMVGLPMYSATTKRRQPPICRFPVPA